MSSLVCRPAWLWRRRVEQLALSDGNWSYSRPLGKSDPAQGWKLHLSATVLSAGEVLDRAWPILRQENAFFKVPRDLEMLRSLNSGLSDFSQVGKFLTVYPRSIDEAVRLASSLHHATRGLPGPRIPFDAHYRKDSLVYYRYGAFRGSVDGSVGFIRAPGGKLYRDKRAPGKAVPGWLDDPFKISPKKKNRWGGLITRELLAFKARAQRGKGGVYDAIDLSVLPVRRVIIKEGRRHGETNWDGRDGFALVKHEGRVLRDARKAGLPVPEILREFNHDRNRYLILERLQGRRLFADERAQPTRTSWRRARRILEQLGPLLAKLHRSGWVWRDCKPSHLFLDRGSLRLIDLEGACRVNERQLLPWGSPEYTPASCLRRSDRHPGTREDDFALGVIAFQMMCGHFPPSGSRARLGFYKNAGCPKSVHVRIEELLRK